MDKKEYLESLKKMLDTVKYKAVQSVLIPAANELLATVKNRIMVDGKNSAGNLIGQYSTKPMYATKDQFVKKGAFKAVGKSGYTGKKIVDKKEYRVKKVKLKSGKISERLISTKKKVIVKGRKPTSMYLPGGYKQLRSIQGRPTDKINQNYSGGTMLAYQQQAIGNVVLQGFTTEMAAKIRAGQEGRFGRIFSPTKIEMTRYRTDLIIGVNALTQKLMNNG